MKPRPHNRPKKRQGKSGSLPRATNKAAVSVGPPPAHPHELRVGESTASGNVVRQIAMQQSWHGPLPPPQQLAEFDAITPGLADRIMKMAEEEGRHSRDVQKRALTGAITTQVVGQVFGLLIAAGCLYASYHLAMAGHDWVAGILGGGTLTTVVLAFLRWKKDSDES